jgi:hypothetical protein
VGLRGSSARLTTWRRDWKVVWDVEKNDRGVPGFNWSLGGIYRRLNEEQVLMGEQKAVFIIPWILHSKQLAARACSLSHGWPLRFGTRRPRHASTVLDSRQCYSDTGVVVRGPWAMAPMIPFSALRPALPYFVTGQGPNTIGEDEPGSQLRSAVFLIGAIVRGAARVKIATLRRFLRLSREPAFNSLSMRLHGRSLANCVLTVAARRERRAYCLLLCSWVAIVSF